MRCIVTGGAGFVGSRLVRRLQMQHRAHVLVIDDFRSGTFANLSDEGQVQGEAFSFQGEVRAADLRDIDFDQLLGSWRPDVVYHEASITDTTIADQRAMIEDNVRPFIRLLHAAHWHGVPLVWASSAATYGTRANGATQQRRPFRLADAGQPANVYGFSKWLMENAHRQTMAAQADSPHLVGLRYFNVFGPGESHKAHMASMVYRLTRDMLDGKRPRIFRDGEQARDHIHVDDVVDATLAAAQPEATPGIYNVGAGRATSFNDVVSAINEALGTSLEPDYIDNPYEFYQDYTEADLSATRAGLGWEPQREPRAAMVEYARKLKAMHRCD